PFYHTGQLLDCLALCGELLSHPVNSDTLRLFCLAFVPTRALLWLLLTPSLLKLPLEGCDLCQQLILPISLGLLELRFQPLHTALQESHCPGTLGSHGLRCRCSQHQGRQGIGMWSKGGAHDKLYASGLTPGLCHVPTKSWGQEPQGFSAGGVGTSQATRRDLCCRPSDLPRELTRHASAVSSNLFTRENEIRSTSSKTFLALSSPASSFASAAVGTPIPPSDDTAGTVLGVLLDLSPNSPSGQTIWKFSRTSSAVAKTIKRYDEAGSHEDHHRNGSPRVTSAAEDKFITVTSLRNRQLTVRTQGGLSPSLGISHFGEPGSSINIYHKQNETER
ncbi:hypothetical protein Z043_113457, partial [Scleropages formosus]